MTTAARHDAATRFTFDSSMRSRGHVSV